MPQVLMIVGAILVLAGMGGIAAGAPDWVLGLSLGATLIQSGTIALVGGIILIALALVLNVLQDLLKRLDALPAGSAIRPAAPVHAGAERPAAGAVQTQAARLPPPAEPAPRPRERESAPAGSAEEPARARRERMPEKPGDEQPRPRRDTTVAYPSDEPARARPEGQPIAPGNERPRPRERTLEQASEELARLRSELPVAGRNGPARTRRDALPPLPQPLPSDDRRRPRPPAEDSGDHYVPRFRPLESASAPTRNSPADTVVRSGVIGGMAYTLYADGSIEAELPIGTVRFGSIAELQEHVKRTGTEADTDFNDPQR